MVNNHCMTYEKEVVDFHAASNKKLNKKINYADIQRNIINLFRFDSETRKRIYPIIFNLPQPRNINLAKEYSKIYDHSIVNSKSTISRAIKGNNKHGDLSLIKTEFVFSLEKSSKLVYYFPNFANFLLIALFENKEQILRITDSSKTFIKNYFPVCKIIHEQYLSDPILRQIIFPVIETDAESEKDYLESFPKKFYNKDWSNIVKTLLHEIDYDTINTKRAIKQSNNPFSNTLFPKNKQIQYLDSLILKYGTNQFLVSLKKIFNSFEVVKSDELIQFRKYFLPNMDLTEFFGGNKISLPSYILVMEKLLVNKEPINWEYPKK